MVNGRYLLLISLFVTLGLATSAQSSLKKSSDYVISPNAIKLDIDDFIFISRGLIGVRKGNKEALIDLQGNFIVPWGKYIYVNISNLLFGNLINVRDPVSNSCGFIDLTGKLIIPISNSQDLCTNFNHFQLASTYHGSQKGNIVDTRGIKYPKNSTNYLDQAPFFSRELYTNKQHYNRILIETKVDAEQQFDVTKNKVSGKIIQDKNGSTKILYKKSHFGYGNKFGVILSTNYDRAREFTENRAGIMKVDEFGTQKWGFIDTLGNLVIPATFKNEPGYFHSGLALVEPTDKTDFQYAYIDKWGKIKITIGDREKKNYYKPLGEDGKGKNKVTDQYGSLSTSLTESGYFINGYAFWQRNGELMLLDTTGIFISLKEFINKPEYSTDKIGPQLTKYDELGIYFRNPNVGGSQNYRGLIGYNKDILFPPFFENIIPDYYSSYALARYDVSEKKPQYGRMLEGIINKEGMFILIREKQETW